MKPRLFDLTYFETYYFANIINNVLQQPVAYLRSLEEFFGDMNYKSFLEPFPKISRLHYFIQFIIEYITHEEIDDVELDAIHRKERKLWIEIALEHFDFEFQTFEEWVNEQSCLWDDVEIDDVMDYMQELRLHGPYEELLERMADEIFFILFLNRQTLLRFNQMIAFQIERKEIDELDSGEANYFSRNGTLKRVNIPTWVKRAVFT